MLKIKTKRKMKTVRLLTMVVMMIIGLSSCSKDNDTDTEGSIIVGIWAENQSSDPNSEQSVLVFNSNNTGSYYNYYQGVKSTPVSFNYTFYEKNMELSVAWVNMPHWEDHTTMVEIRNGTILVYLNVTYYKV